MSQLVFNQIRRLLPTLHGWCSEEKALSLACYVMALRPNIILEVGVWGGKSFLPMALALKSVGGGRIIAVDPWSPQASVEGQVTEADKEWWSNVANHELVYQHFLYNVDELGLRDIVEVHRLKCEEYDPPPIIDILHLDSNHGPQALTEIQALAPKIKDGGLCILDDCQWTGGHVQQASEWLKANGFIELHTLGTGSMNMKLT